MACDYGYGKLENEIIALFRSKAPDFAAAEELIMQGADLNASGKYDDENILSEILSGYWWSQHGNTISEACEECENESCDGCENNRNLNPNLGSSMCAVIRFFLEHGFDVSKNEGCYGAQCLQALALSTFDRYIIDATKMLFDAGAKNRFTSPTATDKDYTPWDSIGVEGSFQDTCEGNHSLGNIFEAVYQIYQAIEDGKPYNGIDSYEASVGKKILKVFSESNDDRPVFFPINLPEFQKENCYKQTLYFVYEGGVLITTQYADFWTDTVLPASGLIDVSDHFKGIVGNTIKSFSFDTNSVVKGTTQYRQPITTIEMDSGQIIRFSINFGQAKKENRAAFFELL